MNSTCNNNNNQSPLLIHDYNSSKMIHSISHSLIGSNSSHLIGPQHHLTSPLNGHGGYQQTTPPHLPLTSTPQSILSQHNNSSTTPLNSSNSLKQETSPLSNSLLVQQPASGSPSGTSSMANLSNPNVLQSTHNTPVGPNSDMGGVGSTPVGVAGSSTPLTTGGSSLGVTDHQQFENDKKNIFNHPLFPLLQLLFDKCETATNSAECPSSASFDLDIENFIHLHERDKKPFYTDNADVNDVMIRAIQVLRIHLLELEKVNELCKDFCQRYIACLKNKMQSDTLLGCGAGGLSPTGNSSGLHHQYPLSESPNSQLQQQLGNCGPGSNVVSYQNALPTSVGGGSINGPGGHNSASMHAALYPQLSMFPGMAAAAAAASSAANFPGYQMNGNAPNGPQGNPGTHPHGMGGGHGVHNGGGMLSGSTPISQVGLQHHPGAGMGHGGHPGMSPLHHSHHHHLLGPHGAQEMNPDGTFKKTKRGVLPKHATQIMRQWLFQHIVHPYPTEDEKRQIAVQTNLTLLQVNNWFINARRRILQPMLEASNPESVTKSKKNKNNRPTAVNRFWPDNLAQGQITNSFKSECDSPPSSDSNNATNNNSRTGPNSGNSESDHRNRDSSAMNNLQLLNSPSALSDCSDDRSSNEPGMSPPPSQTHPSSVINGTVMPPIPASVAASFMSNGFDTYNSTSSSSAQSQQPTSLFSSV